MVSTKDEYELIDFWAKDSNNIMEIPKHLNGKITEDEATKIFVKACPDKQDPIQSLIRYRSKLKEELDRGRDYSLKEEGLKFQCQMADIQTKTLEIQDRGLKIQNSVKKSQWIVAIIMALALSASAASAYFQWQGYLITADNYKAKFIPRIDCTPSDNGTVSVSAAVYNTGGSGRYIIGQYFTKNITTEIIFNPVKRFVEANSKWDPPALNMLLANVTVPSFSIGYKVKCFDENDQSCVVLESEVECNYKEMAGEYGKRLTCI